MSDWTYLGFVDATRSWFEVRSNTSGLTPPMWLWRLPGQNDLRNFLMSEECAETARREKHIICL